MSSSSSSSSSTSIFVSTLRPPPVGSLSLPLHCSFSSFQQQQQLHPQACSISKYGVELGRGPVLASQSLSLLNWTKWKWKWKWKWIATPITTTTAARFPQLRATAAATNDWAAAAAAATPSGEEEGERELQLQPNPQNHPKFHEIVSAVPPTVFAFLMKSRGSGGASNFLVWFCVATAFFVIAVRAYAVRRSKCSRPPGSVADLVRRGQLRSDRRGISRPLKYEDPFNNPLVKVSKSNSTVEMCGKVYRLAPVTLTEEQQAIHQKRRSRAYQWKRPTVFLKEGDSIPPDVDPDTVRWIPANHPFATTASDIDEDLAQNNVYQKHGVPFRIQAEHEALQRKLEALQREQKLDKLVIDTGSAKDFERPFKLNQKSNELVEESPFKNRAGDSKPLKSDGAPSSLGGTSSSEDAKRS